MSVILFGFAVCYALAKAKITKKSKTCTIITPTKPKTVADWLEHHDIKQAKSVILFKRVSENFLTQERTHNETAWLVGQTLEHPNWNPESDECGPGKFHFCATPYFCDEFRTTRGDRYVAIRIAIKDLFIWPDADYPHKIAGRKGKVLYECDRKGNKIETVIAAKA